MFRSRCGVGFERVECIFSSWVRNREATVGALAEGGLDEEKWSCSGQDLGFFFFGGCCIVFVVLLV